MKSLSKNIKRARLSEDIFHLDEKNIRGLSLEELEKLINEKQQQAYTQGQSEGHNFGLEEGVKKGKEKQRFVFEQQIRLVAQMIEEVERKKTDIVRDAELEVMTLAIKVAEKIIQIEVKDKEIVQRLVKAAVEQAVDRRVIEVRVNPKDLEAIQSIKPQILSSIKGIEEMKVVKDSTIAEGGCFISTPSGSIDAQIDSQLDEIKQSLGVEHSV